MHNKFWEEEEPVRQETFSRTFDKYTEELEARQPKTKPSRMGRTAGLVLAAGLLVYGAAAADVPVLCMTIALLAFNLKEPVVKLLGERGQGLANGLQGFAVVLGLGALVMLLT